MRTGKHKAQISPRKRNTALWATGVKDENGKDIIILVKDAASYLTEEFYLCWYMFCMSENLGTLPFSGGWAEQPQWIVTALAALKTESSRCEQEEMEARQQK